MKPLLYLLTTAAAFAGPFTVGPDYQRPSVPAAGATVTAPSFSPDWWTAFDDPALDAAETRALAANQDLRAAIARVEQARAAAGFARSAYLPTIAADPSFDRSRTSREVDNALPVSPAQTFRLPLTLNWELDLFGRVRRLDESARAQLGAAGADFAAFQLALTAEVASTHFTLRALDAELAIVQRTVALRRQALDLVRRRHAAGTAPDLDVARAETELAVTEADEAALARHRSTAEHALAVLLGSTPSSGPRISETPGAVVSLPAVPDGLPSDLLQRRPDVAAAEQTLIAANAHIGVARAAFFPALSLTGSAGYASSDLGNLFDSGSRLWSIGPSLYLPLFQGGRNKANLARARAAFDESVARYRQQILIAFREVADALDAARLLDTEAAAQDRAVASARHAVALSETRYKAGYVTYLEVVDAQRTALEVERSSARLAGQRQIARVTLIKSLGGGWTQPAAASSSGQRVTKF